MGMFDNFNLDDPKTMGLLSAAAGLFGASGPSRTPMSLGSVLGQGLTSGLQGYQGAQEAQAQNRKRQMYEQAEAQKVQAAQARQQALSSIADSYSANPGFKPSMAQLLAIDPEYAIKGMMPGNAEFALDPKIGKNPTTGKVGYFIQDKSGNTKWLNADVPENYKFVAPTDSTPGGIFNSKDGTIELPKFKNSGSPLPSAVPGLDKLPSPSSGNMSSLLPLPEIPINGAGVNPFSVPLAPKRQVVEGPNGPLLVDAKNNTSEAIMGADGLPVGQKLKEIPASANTAIIANLQNLEKAKSAISLIRGQSVGGAQGDKEATGYKGYLPNAILNRVDPSGTSTRAAIADLGSMVIHDRSGAAVTAAESPRLMPFIPLATDDAATVEKKLQRFSEIYQQETDALGEIYGKENGYRPSPVLQNRTTSSTPAAAVSPAPPREAINMLRMNPKLRDQFDAYYGTGAAFSVLGK